MTASITPRQEFVETIAANVRAVRARIAGAAERAGREPAAVRLIGVTKTFPAEVCAAAVQAGLTELGENRVQEGVAKAEALAEVGVRLTWHLIGHLQSNKVKPALGAFAVIHSVDSVDLARAISRRAVAHVDVLLEVNVGGEATKFGFTSEETPGALREIGTLSHVRVRGLMTVAPPGGAESVRPVFRRLRELAERLSLPELSMGMSGDYEVAVEEGATMVRVGSALFGPRSAPGGTA